MKARADRQAFRVARHNAGLAVFIAVVFIAYLAANVILWQRMRPRA